MPDSSNTLLLGFLTVALIGLVVSMLRKLPAAIAKLFLRQSTVAVEVMSGDVLYDWLKCWFDQHDSTKHIRLLTASAVPASGNSIGKRSWHFMLTPAPGHHLFRYQGRLLFVERERKEAAVPDGEAITFREIIRLRLLGRKKESILQLLTDVQELAEQSARNKTAIYTADLYNGWSIAARLDPRPLDSVILESGTKQMLCSDIERFMDSEDWYKSMSIPFHRGYLFYGTPGSGKSSLVRALAAKYSMDIYLLNLSNLSDSRLTALMTPIPSHSIVLLEDIDSAFLDRQSMYKITFSGLLNALDGMNAKNGMLVFMSTNHIERLDPALIRPGRVDVKLYLGHATFSQIIEIYLRFFPNEEIAASEFATSLQGEEISMASVQELLLQKRFGSNSEAPNVSNTPNYDYFLTALPADPTG